MNGLIPLLLAWLFGAGTFDPMSIDSPEQRGTAIATEAQARDSGFGDVSVRLDMTLVSEDGRARNRRLTWKTLEGTGAKEGDKSLTIFHQPRDIEGTAFLTHTKIDESDDQWLYLPALKRVKRIAAANMSSAFVGSELAYEDLLSDEVEKFDYRWLRNEPCGELTCYVLERVPRYEGSGYSRQVLYIDTEAYRTRRVEYFDHQQELLKTLQLQDYEQYLDRYWRARRLEMVNHQSGKSTILEFEDYEFRRGLNEQDLDPAALRHLR